MFPNMMVFLVGPPGVGKSQAINPMTGMLRKSNAVGIAPDDVTKQGLLDALGAASKACMLDGIPFDYHFLTLCISELSNFLPKYDDALAGLLTHLFDCPEFNEEKKRGHDKGKLIPFPGLSFIMGTATQNLGHTISNAMWGSGFMARVVMVFSAEKITPKDMFVSTVLSDATKAEIVLSLARIGDMRGAMTWEPEPQALFNAFRQNAESAAPLHNRLEHYGTRRWFHLGKLIMIAALSDERMSVQEEDFDLALSWLLEAESVMPEIFKDMQNHEDGQVYEEMRSAMYAVYMQTKAKFGEHRPIHSSAMYAFLSTRVSTHNVQRSVEIAVAADYFRRVAGEEDQFIPQGPKGSRNLGVF